MADINKLPVHVGIIMDGNGRWARLRGKERSEGHRQGAEVFREICTYAADLGIKYVTFYAFSTENWKRPQLEVSAIMNIFRTFLREAEERQQENEERGLRFRFIGDMSKIPGDIAERVKALEERTSDKTRTTVNLAVNYGGRAEIVKSVRRIAGMVKNGEIEPSDVDEKTIEEGLYTAGQPDADLIIRPSGEQRLSNFLLWQSAYAEFWYSDVLWPDFTKSDFDKALYAYSKRSRRFGAV
jgi:undecaprenyl diphosphate synthase